jgi:universal stress protein A
MSARPSLLCPVDFSDASRGALRYAAAVASHFRARLVALTVEDPVLIEALDLATGAAWTPAMSRSELAEFVEKTFSPGAPVLSSVDYEVAVGKPAEEILRVGREQKAGGIVISTHGLTGMRKLFFGSTTERVLRETTCPVLVTPAADPGMLRLDDARRLVGRILVPVDLSPASAPQVQAAVQLAETIGVPLILAHVIEPVRSRFAARLHLPGIEAERRATADDRMAELLASLPPAVHAEGLVTQGDPAEEIAKVTRDRRAGMIVIGLHGSPLLGPRMGSVTYRVMCLAQVLMLALPPAAVTSVQPR